MRKRNLSRIDAPANIYHHTHSRPAFINTPIHRREPPHYTQNLHKTAPIARTSRTNLHAAQAAQTTNRTRTTPHPLRKTAHPRRQTAQQQPNNAHRGTPVPHRASNRAEPITPSQISQTYYRPRARCRLKKFFSPNLSPTGICRRNPAPQTDERRNDGKIRAILLSSAGNRQKKSRL